MADVNVAGWTTSYWENNIEECQAVLKNVDLWKEVPSLNAEPLNTLVDKQLVRFRGMIQDMHEPEYYLERFEVRNVNTGQTSLRMGKYRDCTISQPETLVENSPHNVHDQRLPLYCISVPALNSWVRELEQRSTPVGKPSPLANQGMKRSAEGDATGEQMEHDGVPSKRRCSDQRPSGGSGPSKLQGLNLPLPDSQARVCCLKVYDNERLELNSVVEVLGFLSVDPSLEFEPVAGDDWGDGGEALARHPPPSLVPRIHCISVRNVGHCNPLLPAIAEQAKQAAFSYAQDSHQYLRIALTQLLLGDALAADYLMCHLLSTVFCRSELLALGSLPLSISHVPNVPRYGERLYSMLSRLLTQSHHLPLTIAGLSSRSFIPVKDYNTNRLTSAMLQLPKHTHLVVDETELDKGTLGTVGCTNMAALARLVQDQKVEYDFTYYKLSYAADIPVLVLSSGKPILKTPLVVPLEPDATCVRTVDDIFMATDLYLKGPLLDSARQFLSAMKLAVDYTVPEEMTAMIEREFVAQRQQPGSKMSAEGLHNLLVLARLTSLSYGQPVLTVDVWNKVLGMEKARQARVCSV